MTKGVSLTTQRWMFKKYVHFCLRNQGHRYKSISENPRLSGMCESRAACLDMVVWDPSVHRICAYSLSKVLDTVWFMKHLISSNSFLLWNELITYFKMNYFEEILQDHTIVSCTHYILTRNGLLKKSSSSEKAVFICIFYSEGFTNSFFSITWVYIYN